MTSLDVGGVLAELGVDVLREQGEELVAKCPLHEQRTGSADRHPSWSINQRTYVHFCFSCGYRGTLSSLYRDLTGEVPDNLEWELSRTSVVAALTEREEPVEEAEENVPVEVVRWQYTTYADVPEALLEVRNLARTAVDDFGVRWDRETRRWVLPVTDEHGALFGYQYRQKGSEENYPKGLDKSQYLFGLHLFMGRGTVCLVESPLDAVRLWGCGIPAVSSFGAWVSTAQILLLTRNFRRLVLALDNDAAGQAAVEKLTKWAKGAVLVPFDYTGTDAKDPGDFESDRDLRDAWRRSISFRLPSKGST